MQLPEPLAPEDHDFFPVPGHPEIEVAKAGYVRYAGRVYDHNENIWIDGRRIDRVRLVALAFVKNPHNRRYAELKSVPGVAWSQNVRWVDVTRRQKAARQASKGDMRRCEKLCRPVTNGVTTWPSVSEAARDSRAGRVQIHRALRSGKPHKGVHWRYVQDGEELL